MPGTDRYLVKPDADAEALELLAQRVPGVGAIDARVAYERVPLAVVALCCGMLDAVRKRLLICCVARTG